MQTFFILLKGDLVPCGTYLMVYDYITMPCGFQRASSIPVHSKI